MSILGYIFWTRENISLMDKKKEITFWGKVSSMKQVLTARNIYSCMNRGVFLPTESSINLLVILDEISLRTYGEQKTSIPHRFCNIFDLHDDQKNTCIFDEAIQQHLF